MLLPLYKNKLLFQFFSKSFRLLANLAPVSRSAAVHWLYRWMARHKLKCLNWIFKNALVWKNSTFSNRWIVHICSTHLFLAYWVIHGAATAWNVACVLSMWNICGSTGTTGAVDLFTCRLFARAAWMELGHPEKRMWSGGVCSIVCHYIHELRWINVSKERFWWAGIYSLSASYCLQVTTERFLSYVSKFLPYLVNSYK